MKLRNKILAFAAPATAIAATMPIALTSCSVEYKMPIQHKRTYTTYSIYETYTNYDVDTKTTYIYTGIDVDVAGSNRLGVLTLHEGGELIEPSSISVNGKSYKVVKGDVFGETYWYCDITETLTQGAELNVAVKYKTAVKDCGTVITLGIGN